MPPPRKKDRLRGNLSPIREQFPPTGGALRRAGGTAGQKPPGRGHKNNHGQGDWGTYTPWESGRQWGCLVPGRHRTGHPPGQRVRPGVKQPRRRPGAVRRLRPWGNGGQWGCLVLGRHRTGHPVGQRARPGAKQPPAWAGGCLDAGYGCYLPRAIRVIWMHRVGSTARPRIMPS